MLNQIQTTVEPTFKNADKLDRAERALEAADRAALAVRVPYLTFLMFGTYIAVIIAGTTDEQLLRVSPVTLPLLRVELPILSFYLFVPWLFLLFHFNLLLYLILLEEKLQFLEHCAQELPEAAATALYKRLFNFPVAHMLIGQRHDRFLHLVLVLLVWITVIALPLWLLLWAQIAFLPYHEPRITWVQRAAVVLDATLLLLFWSRIVSARSAMDWWKRRLRWAWARLAWLFAWLRVVGRLVLRRPWRSPPRFGAFWHGARLRPGGGAVFLVLTAFGAILASLLIATVPDEPWEQKLLVQLPENWKIEKDERRFFKLTYALFEAQQAPFVRNLDIREHVLTVNDLPVEVINLLREGEAEERHEAFLKVQGINLQGRDLRYARLSKAILPKADLRQAQLQNTDFRNADLPAVDLSGAQLVGADLRNARLHGAKLVGTDLARANLSGAQLVGADLRNARLQGAKLVGADLRRADLSGAQLVGADLSNAQLQEGKLLHAQLQKVHAREIQLKGADLRWVQLQEADLSGADLRNADLGVAQLRGVDLRNGRLQGTNLNGAELEGADVRWAWLVGADLRWTRLQGADMRWAVLQGADVRQARLQGVDLAGAALQGADLRRAQFTGADMSQAGLQGADVRWAELQGADLRETRLQGADLGGVELQGADLRGASTGGTNFRLARLDLVDLRGLDRTAFTEQQLWELGEALRQQIEDASLRERLLDKLRAIVGQATIWHSNAKLCLSDEAKPPPGCVTEAELAEYRKTLMRYLMEIACTDSYVARGLAQRFLATRDADMSQALLQTDCAAVVELSEETKEGLRDIAKRSSSTIGR